MGSGAAAQESITTPTTQFYSWRQYRCAYEVHQPLTGNTDKTPLVLIHPIGVGLSRRFWDPFCNAWLQLGQENQIYNPDLLGCGASDMPSMPYKSEDWAEQLLEFIQSVIQRPVILVVQGALLPAAIVLTQIAPSGLIRGLVLSGPPAWKIMTEATPNWRHQLNWQLFSSPLGQGFYRYARRREFLRSFSERQLFADPKDIDQQWLDMLKAGSENPASRHAVFSFLAGFWRRDWQAAIEHLTVPTLVVIGNTASSISQSGKSETPEQRLQDYLKHLPQGQGRQISGRNVLPYESTMAFVEAIVPFVREQ
ncbi:MAG: alpha/beta hydrolase [Elainellaceae cyanobacterium]